MLSQPLYSPVPWPDVTAPAGVAGRTELPQSLSKARTRPEGGVSEAVDQTAEQPCKGEKHVPLSADGQTSVRYYSSTANNTSPTPPNQALQIVTDEKFRGQLGGGLMACQ